MLLTLIFYWRFPTCRFWAFPLANQSTPLFDGKDGSSHWSFYTWWFRNSKCQLTLCKRAFQAAQAPCKSKSRKTRSLRSIRKIANSVRNQRFSSSINLFGLGIKCFPASGLGALSPGCASTPQLQKAILVFGLTALRLISDLCWFLIRVKFWKFAN